MRRITLPDRTCEQCGCSFNRNRLRGGRIEDIADYISRRFCSRDCYWKWNTGENNWNYVNGVRKRSDGYLRLSDDRYLHRVVMEKHLGRPLENHEHVHHRDGDPSNNDISNLELTTNSEHRKYHANRQRRDQEGKFVA